MSWKVFNIQGIEMLNGKEQDIDIDDLPSGIYFLKINTGGHIITKRIVKSE